MYLLLIYGGDLAAEGIAPWRGELIQTTPGARF